MDINQRKEQFSKAYIHAVATIAGYSVSRPDVDDDSIDLALAAKGEGDTARRPRIELQAKCTHSNNGDEENFVYDLKIKNYDDLRIETIVPRILVVVVVPDLDFNLWMRYTEDEMCLRHRGYWCSILGYPDTPNDTTVRVSMPRTNLFSPDNLRAMMERANREEPL
jgi:Domain of unknown function (DUF4365)